MHEGELHAAMPDTTPQPDFPREQPEFSREQPAQPEVAAPTRAPEPAETEARRRGSTVREPAPIVRYDERGATEVIPVQPNPAPSAQPAVETEPQADRPRKTGWWRR
jgi:hypothetical protein